MSAKYLWQAAVCWLKDRVHADSSCDDSCEWKLFREPWES